MFTVRNANPSDFNKIYSLYKKVAEATIGIARRPHKVTEDYIRGFMEAAAATGIELVIDNPEDPEVTIAEIHCYQMGMQKFNHVLDELTIAVHPAFQGKGLGKMIFKQLLQSITDNRPDILRVELFTQESNARAIALYQQLGFEQEGRFAKRILGKNGLEADIPMAWFNPAYIAETH